MRLRLRRAVCAALAAPLLLPAAPSRTALEVGVEFDQVAVIDPGSGRDAVRNSR